MIPQWHGVGGAVRLVRQTVASFANHRSGLDASSNAFAVMLIPLQSYGILPSGCSGPSEFQDLIQFIGETTQLLMMLGGLLLVAGYGFSGLYWIVAGPDGKRRAIEWVKHVTIGGLILVLAKPTASYIISSFSIFCASGGG